MPKTLSDEAFEALKKTVLEIDFRSKRLVEWRDLGMRLQLSESRFDIFRVKWPATNLPEPAALPDLRTAWSECEQQIDEVSLLPEAFQCITLQMSDRQLDPTVKTWIDELADKGKKLGDGFKQGHFGDMPDLVAQYKAAYVKLNTRRGAKASSEMNLLVALTNELRLKFE